MDFSSERVRCRDNIDTQQSCFWHQVKVIRKFFLKHNKILDGISGITKNIIFFHLKVCERRNIDFCVFLRWVVCPAGGWAPA